MNQSTRIHGSLLAKNTALNLIGQVIPLLVAVVTVPYVIHGLGVERFGILSLAWIVLGYFGLFDLGLGRATTKFIAEALGKGETDRIPAIFWTSLGLISILGFIGVVVLIALTPLFVGRIFNVPAHLIEETKLVFYISSAGILFVLITASLSGVLEAHQRFDLVNMLRIPSNILSSIIPVIAIFFGAGLPFIVLLLVIKNFCMLFFYLFCCFRIVPSIMHFLSIDFKIVPRLFAFGGWMTVINIVSPVLTNIDRFLIISLLSLAAVTYYTPPYGMISKLWVLPASLYMTLFPTFSTIGISQKGDLEHLFAKATKYLILSSGVIVLIIFMFADKILFVWLGNEFARNSTRVFQILALGFFMSTQVWIPSTLLQGIGRPDVVAKLFLFELPLYVGVTWWLIGKMGIEGAALAWTLRGALELLLFYAASWRIVRYKFSAFIQNGTIKGVAALGGLAVASALVKAAVGGNWLSQSIFTAAFLVLFGLVVWCFVMDFNERDLIAKFMKLLWAQGVKNESR